MQFVDTHCHIHETSLGAQGVWAKAPTTNAAALLATAKKAGVAECICVGTTATDSELAVQFAQNYLHCWASVGLHPHEAKGGRPALERLAMLVASGQTTNKIVAIGECGLDYFYGNSPKKAQVAALRFQIELALAHNLPMIFHVRDAFEDFWPIFDSYKNVRGVLHSFTDTQTNLQKALERSLYIGLNGIMTFTKNQWQLDVAKAVPLNKMLLETDAPFLTPHPFRGTVNEPAHVRVVAKFLAGLRQEPIENIAMSTTNNARALFKFKQTPIEKT